MVGNFYDTTECNRRRIEVRIMSATNTDSDIDWTACELVEQVPGKVSGRPVVRGTRILPEAIVNSYELGESVEDLHEGFPSLSVAQIEQLIDFALARRTRPKQ
jgi:uncharacterized protein (DUF433 family)